MKSLKEVADEHVENYIHLDDKSEAITYKAFQAGARFERERILELLRSEDDMRAIYYKHIPDWITDKLKEIDNE